MNKDKRLTENEAREFLKLLDRVEDDLDDAFTDASEEVFGDGDPDDSFEEKWNAPVGQVYTEHTRGRLRTFVKHVYLQEEEPVNDSEEIEDQENEYLGKAVLQPPLDDEEIEEIDDEKLRALAWDLDAIATAYNYATDPTIPDLARDDIGTWVDPKTEMRLTQARSLLKEAYDRLHGSIGDELEQYKTEEP
ncbi:hypothetical protein [Haloterrigena alkaliphila]|uniref:Uncharacterized protein n=1 Tax=Haloterrigena alkaliphila TaxID=2816475 RepID=A0A8A2VCN1_9EURY|nr:hypothetical protein [Haloterrigena alkaliphila]QSW99793.1 hypothetical protein J0X25_02190 [Haloterrigena alkaliphila]